MTTHGKAVAALATIALWGLVSGTAAGSENELLEYSLSELASVRVETASRSIEPLDRTSATVYVITGQDIRTYGYRNLADALENIPGVQTINLGFFIQGGQRGLPGNFAQTLLLVNGREISALATQEALIGDQFGVDNIRQIEVMNSPASALYGANAYSGVINILTKDAESNFDGQRVRYQHGSEGTQAVSLLSQTIRDDRRFSFHYRQYRSDNWDFGDFTADTTHFSNGFPGVAQTAAARAGTDYLNRNNARSWAVRVEAGGFYLGTDGYSITSGKGLETVALDYDSQRDQRELNLWYAGWKGNTGGNRISVEYQMLRDRLWGLNYEFRDDVWQRLLANGRDPQAPLTADDIYGEFQYVYSQENSRGSVRHRGIVQLQRAIGDHAELTLGLANDYADLLGEALDSQDTSPPFDDRVSDDNPMHRPLYRSHKTSAYAQWQGSYFSRRLDVTLGARFDDQTHYGGEHTLRGGLVWHQGRRTHWRLHYGEAFREPNIFELGNFNPIGSPASSDLQPATIKITELGLTQQLSPSQRLQLTAFENRSHGAILPTATATFSNADLDTRGVEAQYDLRAGRWRIDAAYTWMQTDERRVGANDVDTLNVYPQRLSLGTAYIPAAHWRLALRTNYFSRLDAEHGNPQVDEVVEIASAVRMDANIRYTTTFFDIDDTEIALNVHNLFERDYYQPNVRNSGPREFLQPGRQWLLSVSLLY